MSNSDSLDSCDKILYKPMRFMTETKLYNFEDDCCKDCDYYECYNESHWDKLIYSYDFEYKLIVDNIYKRIPIVSSKQLIDKLPENVVLFQEETKIN